MSGRQENMSSLSLHTHTQHIILTESPGFPTVCVLCVCIQRLLYQSRCETNEPFVYRSSSAISSSCPFNQKDLPPPLLPVPRQCPTGQKRERVSFVCANYFVHLTKYSRLEYVGREIKLVSSSSRHRGRCTYYITVCVCIDENAIALSRAVCATSNSRRTSSFHTEFFFFLSSYGVL